MNQPSFGRDAAAALADDLSRRLEGEVRFDAGSRALYATDASNYRQVPIGVVVPRSRADVVEAVAICRLHGAPLLARGGGTSLAGQCCNVAVVLDCSKYLNRIIALDPAARTARVEPGVVLDTLRTAAEAHNLTFAPDPATHSHNTLGGMIGNNSCGPHSVMAGRTADNVLSLDVLTYEGLQLEVGATTTAMLAAIAAAGGARAALYARLQQLAARHAAQIRARYPPIPRRVSGYNLDELLPERGFQVARALVGSEGTCVTVLEATLQLVPSPPHKVMLVLGFHDICAAGDHAAGLVREGVTALEGFDDALVRDMRRTGLHTDDLALLPDGRAWLMVEFGADVHAAAQALARAALERLSHGAQAPPHRLFDTPAQQRRLWEVRESSLGATAHVPGQRLTWEGWEDAAVPPERLGDYLRAFKQLLARYGYQGDIYGHFGQGCVHVRIDYELTTAAGIARFHAFAGEAADTVLRFGGSLSGEHGDGQARAEFLPRMFGAELVQAFEAFKAIWDPQWKMNPGKIVRPNGQADNLRLGTGYQPAQPVTFFKYPHDRGDFGRVSLRCVGVGECRRATRGTMCPSYRATGEEQHSTRGRARLLFEMLRGDVIQDGWRSQAVRDSLALCLACKGCKGDCPVGVDMATYKAEFLAHHYAGRLRPRAAWLFGRIDFWASLGVKAPHLINAISQGTWSAAVCKAAAGVAPQRRLPLLATVDVRRWHAGRAPVAGAKPVMLWMDTFNRCFTVAVMQAAIAVLEAAGSRVMLSPPGLCCGRPLYDYGWLLPARRRLQAIIAALRPQIRAGVPLVVLEPACASVFQDELANLLPADQDGARLRRQTMSLASYLQQEAPAYAPALHGAALLHGHCHQKALTGLGDESALLRRLGMDCTVLDSGCCGMAGAFGFQARHYAISQQIAALALLPAVRAAPPQAVLVADGYSCREQLGQAGVRPALHLAQLLARAER
ncbi:MAG TPA: FAD-binding and (Fe-S)-binding domain-containing protein [Telluria sp.]|nr:FAD-binding and (Fe-S)-binding domain-containing protein [Telluria sp.]